MKTKNPAAPGSNPPAAGEAAPFALPLEISVNGNGGIDICETGAGDMVADLCNVSNAEEKAAFIVRACNSHAALVAALEQLVFAVTVDAPTPLPEDSPAFLWACAALAGAKGVQST